MNCTNRFPFVLPAINGGREDVDSMRKTLRVKSESRFDALLIMFMLDTNYTLGEQFLINYRNGEMDAFTARKLLAWAKSRADESRHEAFCRECEREMVSKIIASCNREHKTSARNRSQLCAIGIF